jgi:MFS family permease
MVTAGATAASSHTGPFAALHVRDFRLYWFGGIGATVGEQIQMAAVAWQVYALTHSPVALGVMGLFRVVPIVLFSLIGGVMADSVNRRSLLLATSSAMAIVTTLLAVLTITGAINIWLVYLLTGLEAAALAFDTPARQALIPSMVPAQRLPNALSLMGTSGQLGSVVGPTLSGLLIAGYGIGAAYVVSAAGLVPALIALLLIRPPAVEGDVPSISMGAALEGLRFVWTTPIILSNLALDFVATFFGSATALLPIFARDILRVGPSGYGILYSAPAAGAITAGVLMAFFATRVRRKGVLIIVAICFYALFTALFGASRIFALSLVALAGVGFSDTVSMIFRQTIRQLATPDALRGRMTSVNMVFFMGGPQLGEVEAGVVARLFGAPVSVISGGVAALMCTLIIAVSARRLREYRG